MAGNMTIATSPKSYAASGDVIWHLTGPLEPDDGRALHRDQVNSAGTPGAHGDPTDSTIATLQAFGVFQGAGCSFRSRLQQNIRSTTPISRQPPLLDSNSWTATSPRAVTIQDNAG